MKTLIPVQPLLPDTDRICFVVPALFRKSECEALLSAEVKASFEGAIHNYPTYYRNNERFVVDSPALAAQLFDKVKPYLPEIIETHGDITSENGTWSLHVLNERLRFCKYAAHQYFHRHLDGVHYRSDTEQSKLTFMIYLNDASAFKGGRTLFYKEKDSVEPWVTYVPACGDLIVFDHNLWHEGEVLEQGEKFVLRSDILYRRQTVERPAVPFSGHLGYIWQLLKFDERTILSGGRDKEIKVWNIEGKEMQRLQGHEHSILCLEKMDDQTFLSASRDQKIGVWQRQNEEGFQLQRNIHIHTATVLSLCRLTNNVFASSAGDNTIKICRTDGQVLRVFAGHTNWVWQVLRLQDNVIASCSEDGTVSIWNTDLDTSLASYNTEHPVVYMLYLEEQRQLIWGDMKGFITIRALSQDFGTTHVKRFQAHKGIIRCLKLLPGNLFASGAEDNLVKVWDLPGHNCIHQEEHHNFVQALELLDDKTLLSASYDGTIRTIPLPSHL